MTAAERWRGGWGQLGIQGAGHSTETGFTNACSIVGAGGRSHVCVSKFFQSSAQAIPAQPPKFQHPDPKIFLQHKMPGPPEP